MGFYSSNHDEKLQRVLRVGDIKDELNYHSSVASFSDLISNQFYIKVKVVKKPFH